MRLHMQTHTGTHTHTSAEQKDDSVIPCCAKKKLTPPLIFLIAAYVSAELLQLSFEAAAALLECVKPRGAYSFDLTHNTQCVRGGKCAYEHKRTQMSVQFSYTLICTLLTHTHMHSLI